MATAVFPMEPVPQFPYTFSPQWKTIISQFDGGNEQRRQKWTYPKYDIELTYNALPATDFKTIYDFYQARKGAYEDFYFWTAEPTTETTWANIYVGVGDGSSTTFDCPIAGASVAEPAIYYNGTQIAASYVAVTTGAGSDTYTDLITIATGFGAPTSTMVLTCDGVGKLRCRVRFQEDSLNKQALLKAVYQTGLKLKGLNAT